MAYYKILIRQIPRILFAHMYKTDHYDMPFPLADRMIEISLLEQGDVVKTYEDGEQVFIPTPSLVVSFRDRAFSMRSKAPLHSHSTVGLFMDFEKYSITKEQVVIDSREAYKQMPSHCLTAILPDFYEIHQQNSSIEKRIKQIIQAHASPSSTRDICCNGLLFNFLTEITEKCVRNAIASSTERAYGSIVYVQHAMQDISRHLDQKITIEEIAAYLKISSGYFSRLFKSVTGQTVVEYINRVKVERVKEMIVGKQITLREAGESVGIYDENYLSRIFKKYAGLTMREYRALKTY